MLKSRHIDFICIAVATVAFLLTILFMNGTSVGLIPSVSEPGYKNRLFDRTRVHTIDIRIDDWETFLANAQDESYVPCTVIIDGEPFQNVGLRVKGNNSKTLVHKYGLKRYSLKVEFDHYTSCSYYGLDKLSLDASFQDNSYMKTWLAFDMMDFMGVPTPLCSYTNVTVNGELWGLFLAIEEPEEAFAKRIYGKKHGQLYKPEYYSPDDENADIALKYIDDDPYSYDAIFREAKFDITNDDQQRLIQALKILSSGEHLDMAVNIEEVLRYFVVQTFVINLDGYLGMTGHNYILYEENGIISILPWDYNLAFTTYSLAMPNPVNDAQLYVNYPIDTPAPGYVMKNRPLYHITMQNNEYFDQYHVYFDQFITDYFESGYFTHLADNTTKLIAPYVKEDPTAFCSYEDFLLGAKTIHDFCLLRSESIRGQLEGEIGSSFRAQEEDSSNLIDASSIWLPDMGEIADLKD